MHAPWLTLPLAFCALGCLSALLLRSLRLHDRLDPIRVSWILAAAPFSASVCFSAWLPAILSGQALVFRIAWMPSLELYATLYLDSLSALFALLVTGIGTLIIIYTGYYFRSGTGVWRFLAYILLFMTAMLGLVIAGDVITLFLFWEVTSVASFLLIAYKYTERRAREGAFKSLLITGGGGIALLAGLLILAREAGSSEFATILACGQGLRESGWYPWMLGLILIGVFAKSAQIPTHIWLPSAMSAPTPASAYLHSATMVKAGIYLIARLNPALGGTDLWFWLLSSVGLVTMLTGAYSALRENDLKGILAYTTVSQLGALTMLVGQETELAFKALVIGLIAHATYKSSLFMVAGIIDHETGTRDLRELGGLGGRMPLSFAVALIAGLSMAGLPPLFGFLAKETLIATVIHPEVPRPLASLFALSAVLTGAFMLALAGIVVADTFLGKPGRKASLAHDPLPGMLLCPALPATLSLLVGVLPEPRAVATFLADAAGRAYGGQVKVSLAIWTGLQPPLLLGAAAMMLGAILFRYRRRVRALEILVEQRFTLDIVYAGLLGAVDRLAGVAACIQRGRLRTYLVAILVGLCALLVLFGPVPVVEYVRAALGNQSYRLDELTLLRLFVIVLALGAAVASVVLRRDLQAVLALGASSLSVAVLMVLEPAPDVSLVQVVVDILATVILVLALSGLPQRERLAAETHTFRQQRAGLARDVLIAISIGAVMTGLCLVALVTRPRPSVVTPFYEQNAKRLTGATDTVGAIVVDFRGFDTLVEIAVFSMAGLAILTLLSRTPRQSAETRARQDPGLMGIREGHTSVLLRLVARVTLPLAMLLAATHAIYGHDQPGDGFTAGVIISLAVALWYMIFGCEETRRRLPWLRPIPLIGAGLLLGLGGATIPALMGRGFFAPVDFGKLLGLPLPRGFSLSTSLFFEVAICLAVMGSSVAMLDNLGQRQLPARESESGCGDNVWKS